MVVLTIASHNSRAELSTVGAISSFNSTLALLERFLQVLLLQLLLCLFLAPPLLLDVFDQFVASMEG